MSITRSLANQGFSPESESGIIYSTSRLSGYRYRWETGRKVFAKAVTPLWSNTAVFGGGSFTEYGYSNTLPKGHENLKKFSVARSFIKRPTWWSYCPL